MYVEGSNTPFATIEIDENLKKLNNKIIECKWNENKWEFMRERLDKNKPNHYKIASSTFFISFLNTNHFFLF